MSADPEPVRSRPSRGPDPAVAAVRTAVRRSLRDLSPDALVLVACSGGADSLALAAATAFVASEGGRSRFRAGAVVIDHGLQAGSDAHSERVAEVLRGLGLAPVDVRRVTVGTAGGPEAAAREARYAALDAAAIDHGTTAILLGHTRDDQAESVLLGLARGSGTRSLAGMAPVRGLLRRPLLDVTRSTTESACAALGLTAWHDPHNDNRAYARVRVRREVLPVLEASLGEWAHSGVTDGASGSVAAALARSARLARQDADALDALAREAHSRLSDGGDPADGVEVAALAALLPAIRTRVLRLLALSAGAPAGSLSAAHIDAVDALVTDWHGQGAVGLPSGVSGVRRCDRLFLG